MEVCDAEGYQVWMQFSSVFIHDGRDRLCIMLKPNQNLSPKVKEGGKPLKAERRCVVSRTGYLTNIRLAGVA